jgi:hypothetical protein
VCSIGLCRGVPGPRGKLFSVQTIGGSTHGRCWRLQYSRPVLNPFSTRLNLYKSTGRTAVGAVYTHNSRGLGLTVLSPWLFLFSFSRFSLGRGGAQGGKNGSPTFAARPLKYIFSSLQCPLLMYTTRRRNFRRFFLYLGGSPAATKKRAIIINFSGDETTCTLTPSLNGIERIPGATECSNSV